jgi:hypothetical protein
MHHTQHAQVEPIEHRDESRFTLVFPFAKQLTARVPNVRWSTGSTQLTNLVILPVFLKPATRTRLSSASSDKAGITTSPTADQGRQWHKVDVTPAEEARCLTLSDERYQLPACIPHSAKYLHWPVSCSLYFCQKVRPEQRKCADITKLAVTKIRQQ